MTGRLIDADAVEKITWEDSHYYDPLNVLTEVREKVRALPTVDAVPVIRCKECKHSEPWYRDRRRCFLWAETGIDVWNDGFCNYAERKEE